MINFKMPRSPLQRSLRHTNNVTIPRSENGREPENDPDDDGDDDEDVSDLQV